MTTNKTQTACDYCGQLIVENGHTYTNDISIGVTTYNADGTPHKTELTTSVDYAMADYIVVCPDCEDKLFKEWNYLCAELITRLDK